MMLFEFPYLAAILISYVWRMFADDQNVHVQQGRLSFSSWRFTNIVFAIEHKAGLYFSLFTVKLFYYHAC